MDVISPPAPLSPIDVIERAYGHVLRHERNFMSASLGQHLTLAGGLLWHRFRHGKIRLKEPGMKEVSDFF